MSDKPPPPEEHRFKPGQSGNPSGRPPSKRVRKAIRHMEPKARAALELAVSKGEPWAVTLWYAYYYGKPVDQLQLSGKNGEALQVSVQIIRRVTGEETHG